MTKPNVMTKTHLVRYKTKEKCNPQGKKLYYLDLWFAIALKNYQNC